jgi:hypothetical protein
MHLIMQWSLFIKEKVMNAHILGAVTSKEKLMVSLRHVHIIIYLANFFFCNFILLQSESVQLENCVKRIRCSVEECSVALLCN